jgi:integrase
MAVNLPRIGMTMHGIRKAYQTTGAEDGMTPHELQALAGHKQLAMTEQYTRKTQRVQLAIQGAAKRRIRHPEFEKRPPNVIPRKVAEK